MALVVAFLAGVAVAVLSMLVAAVRAGTIRPTEALREAAVKPKRIGRIRLLSGLIALFCGVAVLAVAVISPPAATDPTVTFTRLGMLSWMLRGASGPSGRCAMAGGSPPSGPARHWRTRWRIGSRRTSRRPAAARFPGRSS